MKNRSMNPRRSRVLGMETLESRQVMAVGDVLVQMNGPAGSTPGFGRYVAVEETSDTTARVAVVDVNAKAIHVYTLAPSGNTFALTSKGTISVSPDANDAGFGTKDIAMRGGKLYVGGNNAIYEYDTADLEQAPREFEDDPSDGLNFAYDFAVSEKYVAVVERNPTAQNSGKISIYNAVAATLDAARTTKINSDINDGKGMYSVALEGEKLAIGTAFVAESSNLIRGAKEYVFDIATTSPAKILGQDIPRRPGTSLTGDYVPEAVSMGISGDRLVVGVPRGGAAQFVAAGGGIFMGKQTEFTATTPSPLYFNSNGLAGYDVAVQGRIAAVSEHGRIVGANRQPVVHIYDTSSNTEIATPAGGSYLTGSEIGASFGHSLTLSGRFLAVGAIGQITILNSGALDIPRLDLKTGANTYTEDGPAVLIAPNAEFKDLDNDALNSGKGKFAGGKLTVEITENYDAEDVLDIKSATGTAKGIFVKAGTNEVHYRSVGGSVSSLQIGTIVQREGRQFIIQLLQNPSSSAVTHEAVQALMRSISYRSLEDKSIPGKTRTIQFSFYDGGDGKTTWKSYDSTPVTKRLNIKSVNDAPIVELKSTAATALNVNYAQTSNDSPAAPIAGNIVLLDPDGNYGLTGAKFTVTLANANVNDVLNVRSGKAPNGSDFIVVKEGGVNKVKIGETTYATFTTALSTDNKLTLEITFQTKTWNALAQEIVKNITYKRKGTFTPIADRALTFSAVDAAGLASEVRTKTLKIVRK